MRFFSAVLILGFAAFVGRGQPAHIAPTAALSPQDQLKTFTLPVGFEVQLVAAEPLIGKPIQCAFDARGRLWVATSQHYPFAADGPATDAIYILSDMDLITGKAGRVTKFASDLNIPIGVLPLPDCASCLASEVGRIVRLADTTGDGVADTRETILDGFGTRDTHGMMNSFLLMPDGWVYACHGFSNVSKVRAKDGSEVMMESGNTFRFRPDGSRVEPWTFGQVNPFGLTADPWFNLYTADCHSKPITQLIRGATYQSFAKPHNGLGFAPHVARHDHGSTALCGLAWLDSPAFPKNYASCMVLGNVVTNRVNCDAIRWHGSTPEAVEMPDLLASSDPWFRPVDCQLGPDGAVYVTDFYNKIIGHYEVDLHHPERDKHRGRVWRIVYRGEGATPPPPVGDLTALPTAAVDALLGHPSLAVRLPATLELQRRREVPARNPDGNEFYQAHRVWVSPPDTTEPDVDSELVRVHRLNAATARNESIPPTPAPTDRLSRVWMDRLAALPDVANLEQVLHLQAATPRADTHRAYAANVALRNTLAAPGGFEAAARFRQFHEALAAAALGDATERAAEFLAMLPNQNPDTLRHIGRHGSPDAVNKVLAWIRPQTGEAAAVLALEALQQGHQARGQALPREAHALATEACGDGLTRPEWNVAVASANLAAGLKLAELADPLARLITDSKRPAPERIAAAHALVTCGPDEAAAVLAPVLVDPTADPNLREQSAVALGRLGTPAAQEALGKAFAVVPARLAQPIAVALATRAGAATLLDAVRAGQAAPQLLVNPAVRDRLVQAAPDLADDVTKLTQALPTEDGRTAELIRARQISFAAEKPDRTAGQVLFTKHCAACHQMAGEGGKIGPQLDGIGNRGLERLLEDVLAPNRNVDAAFRATTLNLLDGRTLTGLVIREEGAIVVLADGAGQEVRVPAADVDTRTVTPLSPMPANFDTVLSEAEFRNLLAFLLAQRPR